MQPIVTILRFRAAVWACTMFMCLPAFAQQETLQVLILNTFDESAAPYFRPTEEFKKGLQRNYTSAIAFQDIDLKQHGTDIEKNINSALAQLLVSQYSEKPPQLVVAIGPPAINFWVRHRESVFPDALFVAMARESVLKQAPLRPGDAKVATRFSFTGVIEDILQLKPETSHVFMVLGDSRSERVLTAAAKMELEPYFNQINLEFANDMTIHEVQAKVDEMPPNSVVWYGIFSGDVNGVRLPHYAGLAIVRAASHVPVFGIFNDQLGKGILGGSLIQTGKIGIALAEAAQDLLSSTSEPTTLRVVELSEPTYDWTELKEWGISHDQLPPGSRILFEPQTFWGQYSAWIIGASFVIFAQTLLLVSLLYQRQQRRKAELAHASLGRRMITAGEDERRLLARELHDDLSQRLARVAMDASYAHSNQGTNAANEVLKNLQPELVNISRDVHDMSYRIHPSLVDDLGIVTALESEIERVQRRSNADVTGKISEIRAQPPPETALCIYRIAQEALQNAIKHAQANAIEILFKQDSEALMLTVCDDGVGFDFGKVHDEFSLGLSSMQERATLVGGRLNIRSRIGEGTTVNLSVPCVGAGT